MSRRGVDKEEHSRHEGLGVEVQEANGQETGENTQPFTFLAPALSDVPSLPLTWSLGH